MEKFPATLELVMYSAPVVFLGGIKLGRYVAIRAYEKKRGEDPVDFIIRIFMFSTYSIPAFFVGTFLISIVFTGFQWLSLGRIGTDVQLFITNSTKWNSYTCLYTIDALLNGQFWIFTDALKHLALPVVTLIISMLPVITTTTRSSMLSELSKPYVTMAKAKGLDKAKTTNHAKRNAMPSVLTVSSMMFASMLTGVVVTESTFLIPGIGHLAVEAASPARCDFPVLVGLSMIFCTVFVVINLVVDIIYAHLDPRINL